VPKVPQPITDDAVKVRQLSHYQFTWVAGREPASGTFTLQLVLDQGAWEEIAPCRPKTLKCCRAC